STDVALSWPTCKLSHPDLYPLDVAAYVLTQGRSSRLAQRIVYGEPLALSVDSASYTPHYVEGTFVVFASCPPQNVDKASEAILEEVNRLKTELISPSELAKAKKQKASELIFGRQTVADAADSMARSYLSTGDPLFDEHYVKKIQEVTAEQIRDAAQRYFVADRLSTILILPKGEKDEAEIVAAKADESEIQRHVLDNGLKVLIKRHANLPLVNIQAYALGAALTERKEQAGLGSLLALTLDKGTKNYDAKQIAEFFDSRGGTFGMSSGRNTIYGSATVMKEDYQEALTILAECVVSPTFPEDEFAKMKTQMLSSIDRRAASAQAEIFELFSDQLPATTPYRIVQGGKKETVAQLTVEDCRKSHAESFVPQNMVVAVFGDIDPKEALALVKQRFGGMKKTKSFKPVEFKRDNSLKANIVKHLQTKKKTGVVMMGFPQASIFDKEDYAALMVLDAVTSGYGYPGGWLHNELRGEGRVYFVHAFQITGPAPGYFAILAQTQPETVGEVVGRIQKNLEKAKAGKITDEEFDTA
ncbi:MAG: insulinase family protein, partial [Planctomycetales bacterium]